MHPRRPRSSRRVAAAALAAAVLVVGCTSAGVDDHDAGAGATSTTLADPLLLVRADTPVRAPSVEPAQPALPVLPVPEPIPLDPHAAAPEVVIGRITVPRLGIDEELHQGMTLTAINRGPSHWPGTALPGQVGNVVIAGHRTTYSHPFLHLDLVEPGDEMVLETSAGRFRYRATGTEIVDDDALWIADQTYEFQATTFACHPKGSARQRIVVRWQLVDEAGEPVPALA